MAKVYAALIIKGRKTLADVPEKIRADVKRALIDMGHPDLAEESA